MKHDLPELAGDPVFARYPRAPRPSPLSDGADVECPVLNRAATIADVEHGRAIFSLQGLGRARRVELPQPSLPARWHALRLYPFRSGRADVDYDNDGTVCQAEELIVNGVARRYLGFAFEHGIAAVPAAEIELELDRCEAAQSDPVTWMSIGGALDLGLIGPALPRLARDDDDDPDFDARYANDGAAAPIELWVRNRSAAPQTVPAHWFGSLPDASAQRLPPGSKLELRWAPYDPRADPREYPHAGLREDRPDRGDFVRVAPAEVEILAPTGSLLLASGQRARVGTLDLRQLYALAQDGHYALSIALDGRAMGLNVEPPIEYAEEIEARFDLGVKPRTLSVAELNAQMPLLGGFANAQRLRDLITLSLPPLPVPNELEELAVMALSDQPRADHSASGRESAVHFLLWANRETIEQLRQLDARLVAAVVERRLRETRDESFKLTLASLAAAAGSREGALYLLGALEGSHHAHVLSTHSALAELIDLLGPDPPDWAVELALVALGDDRLATNYYADRKRFGGPPAGASYQGRVELSYLAENYSRLPHALGRAKARRALPFLVERIERVGCRPALTDTLAAFEDRAALPTLLRCMYDDFDHPRRRARGWSTSGVRGAFTAIAAVKDRSSVPLLLEHLDMVEAIEALEAVGDPRAVAPLQALVAAGGELAGEPDETRETKEHRRNIARIALVALTPGDRVQRLCMLLEDDSVGVSQRVGLVTRLGAQRSATAAPCLGRAIQSDPDGMVALAAIHTLARLPYRASVEALVAALDADYDGRSAPKQAHSPADFRAEVEEALHALTGERYGARSQRWRDWWAWRGRAEFVDGREPPARTPPRRW